MVPFFISEAASVAASGTQNYRCGQGGLFTTNATEAYRQTLYRTAGTFTKLYITILTNDRGASTFRTRINSANANLLVSITASTTGEFEDTVNSDTIASGDTVGLRLVTGAGGTTFTFNVARIIFTASSNVSTVFSTTANNIAGSTIFQSMAATSGSSGTEAFNQMKCPIAGTFRYLGIYVSANTRDAAVTYISRVNTANGNQSASIGSTLTGWFEDVVNTDTIAVGDLINYSGVTGGTTGTVTSETNKSAFESTLRQFIIAGNGATTTNVSTTVYYPPGGASNGVSSATEANVAADSGSSFVGSRITIYVSANTVVAASTFRLRVNAANVNQVVSLTGLTTGFFTDSTNTDSILTTDSLANQLAVGAGGTSLTTRSFSMAGQLAAIGGSTLLYMGVG